VRSGSKTTLAWLLAGVWGVTIWRLGGDPFSMQSTSRFLDPLLAWLSPDWTDAQRIAAAATLRKLAHLGEYGLFALLLGRAVALATRVRMRRVVATSLVGVGVLAAADELRQATSSLRTGSPADVALDLAGGLLALAALFALQRRLGRPMFASTAGSGA
jgi:VanZ family protein